MLYKNIVISTVTPKRTETEYNIQTDRSEKKRDDKKILNPKRSLKKREKETQDWQVKEKEQNKTLGINLYEPKLHFKYKLLYLKDKYFQIGFLKI